MPLLDELAAPRERERSRSRPFHSLRVLSPRPRLSDEELGTLLEISKRKARYMKAKVEIIQESSNSVIKPQRIA